MYENKSTWYIHVFYLFQRDMIKRSLGKSYCWWKAKDESLWGRFAEHIAQRLRLLSTVNTSLFFTLWYIQLNHRVLELKGSIISFSKVLSLKSTNFIDLEASKSFFNISLSKSFYKDFQRGPEPPSHSKACVCTHPPTPTPTQTNTHTQSLNCCKYP